MRIYKDIDTKGLAKLPSGFLVGLEDAASWLGVSDESLRRYIAADRIEAVREDGTHGRMGWRWAFMTDELNRIKKLAVTTERVILP